MKYEYFQTTLVLTDSTLRDQLNELGELGWEMINAIPVHGTSHMTYVFKKQKKEDLLLEASIPIQTANAMRNDKLI